MSSTQNQTQTLTTGPRTYRLTLHRVLNKTEEMVAKSHQLPSDLLNKTIDITARSITAAIALLYEQHPEYSSVYRVVNVEEVSDVLKPEENTQTISPLLAFIRRVGTREFAMLPDFGGESKSPISDTVTINGAKIIGPALVDILNMVTQPNPRRWYRFERQGENILVHTKQDEDSK